MSLLTTRTARSVMYVFCIGGLLMLSSVAVTTVWNALATADERDDRKISLLEGAGVSAIAYVLLTAIRYGTKCDVSILDSLRRTGQTTYRRAKQDCSHLTPEQKAALKKALVDECGCRGEQVPMSSSKNIPPKA
ncbi:MAG: hypothetical protein D8M52_00125 [Chlorobi bacterium]|nr:MAG: hypothetical protein F9K28_08085 [Bacteroidota bacterium]MBE2265863.1 hypothetical protein [Flavobacteriales bacterium]MBL1160109.1 hypothetical protein [Chlorobiota bacterium]MBW7854205.1 hypothetical protein [Candidatus Kapabacteria bacterium]MCC6330581.1 hypothetical protein [Ignavibacteria bacterium]